RRLHPAARSPPARPTPGVPLLRPADRHAAVAGGAPMTTPTRAGRTRIPGPRLNCRPAARVYSAVPRSTPDVRLLRYAVVAGGAPMIAPTRPLQAPRILETVNRDTSRLMRNGNLSALLLTGDG